MGDESAESPLPPLIGEATKKASVAWITAGPAAAGQASAKALWCLWIDDALYVVCGPGEQTDPGLADVAECSITLRGDHNGRIVSFAAEVSAVPPDDPRWEPVSTALAGKRLNGSAEQAERWARDCAIYRLAPTDRSMAAGAELPSDALRAAPEPSPATTRPKLLPARWGRNSRR